MLPRLREHGRPRRSSPYTIAINTTVINTTAITAASKQEEPSEACRYRQMGRSAAREGARRVPAGQLRLGRDVRRHGARDRRRGGRFRPHRPAVVPRREATEVDPVPGRWRRDDGRHPRAYRQPGDRHEHPRGPRPDHRRARLRHAHLPGPAVPGDRRRAEGRRLGSQHRAGSRSGSPA